MTFFRQYIAPLLVVLIFLVALLAVSARIFLPDDMSAPAPIAQPEQVQPAQPNAQTVPTHPEVAGLSSGLETLVKGLPITPAVGTRL
jgi:hypothetical protein